MQSLPSARISMRIPMLLVITAFILLKLPHLAYPYYWDESWPYISAVKAMYAHGPSLSPSALPPDLSRGHPLLFHAMAAVWMNIFGDSNISIHCFALGISLVLLVYVFEVTLRLFGMRQAVAATLFLATQEIFFVQSSFVLPEVMLALLCLSGLHAYAAGRFAKCALLLTAAVFTKETGLVLVMVLGADALAGMFSAVHSGRRKIVRALCVLTPCVAYATFLLLQKSTHGWYFYPLHKGYVNFDIDSVWYHFRTNCLTHLFSFGNRHVYLLVTFIGLLLATVLRKVYYLSALLSLCVVTYCVTTDRLPGHMPSMFWLILFTTTWLAATHITLRAPLFKSEIQQQFFKLSSWFILCFLLFSAANFYTIRYLMAPLVILVLIITLLIFELPGSKQPVAIVFTCTLLYASLGTYRGKHGHGDTNLGAFQAMKVQQAITHYFEESHLHQQHIASGAYLETVHLTTPSTGFLRYPLPFSSVKWDIDDSTEYIIFDSIEPDSRRQAIEKDAAYKLVYRFAAGDDWGEVYKKVQVVAAAF